MLAHRLISVCTTFAGALATLITCPDPTLAFAEDGCEKQRALFPTEWSDISKEKPRFLCEGKGLRLRVSTGAPDEAGRVPMSLAEIIRDGGEQIGTVWRIWLDAEQERRLAEGRFFATLVRAENACWTRGHIDPEQSEVFLMDNAKPPPDGPDAGMFYNKAPRFSFFRSTSLQCEAEGK